jgi:hypothetical protein
MPVRPASNFRAAARSPAFLCAEISGSAGKFSPSPRNPLRAAHRTTPKITLDKIGTSFPASSWQKNIVI